MQCQPVDSASMNLEGLRRYHVEGVKRTSDPLLMSIQEGLRYVIANTSGGLFFAGGYGGADPVDAVIEARNSVYKVCEEMQNGDVILAATRVCPHCGQSAIEKCTCMTAETLEDVNFASPAKRELYVKRHTKIKGGGRDEGIYGGIEIGTEIGIDGDGGGGGGGRGGAEVDLEPLTAYSSVALAYARELATSDFGGASSGEFEWKCTKTIRGTVLVNGTRFRADKLAPTFGGVDLTAHIGVGITFSPTSTIHSYQGITFEGGKLYLDMNMIWDVRMLYVAVSRVRCREQLAIVTSSKETRYMGEGVEHRTEKARQFGLARAAGQGAIEEYPVIEVVVTSPPSRENLEYYAELGVECVVIDMSQERGQGQGQRAQPRSNSTPCPPPMFVDDSDTDEGEEE
ncbi:hypothetical protein T492DRAFT_1042695 [Pavlovales sp. CCMP2436]|nr:hypothetical protein T492DRAFT_1042695 [Pavlovales sp. CCMP2436]